MPRIEPNNADSQEELWAAAHEAASKGLLGLEPNTYAVWDLDEDRGVFIQYARIDEDGSDCLLGEVGLGDASELAVLATQIMETGWHPPGSYAPGDSPNYQCMWRAEAGGAQLTLSDASDAATMLVNTLRFVFGVSDPFAIKVTQDHF